MGIRYPVTIRIGGITDPKDALNLDDYSFVVYEPQHLARKKTQRVSAFLESEKLQIGRIRSTLGDSRKYKVVELPTVTHPGRGERELMLDVQSVSAQNQCLIHLNWLAQHLLQR